jgi:hypothetical protein
MPYAGGASSITYSGVTTFPFSRVTDLPSVSVLKCTYATQPSLTATDGKNFPRSCLGSSAKE